MHTTIIFELVSRAKNTNALWLVPTTTAGGGYPTGPYFRNKLVGSRDAVEARGASEWHGKERKGCRTQAVGATSSFPGGGSRKAARKDHAGVLLEYPRAAARRGILALPPLSRPTSTTGRTPGFKSASPTYSPEKCVEEGSPKFVYGTLGKCNQEPALRRCAAYRWVGPVTTCGGVHNYRVGKSPLGPTGDLQDGMGQTRPAEVGIGKGSPSPAGTGRPPSRLLV